MTSGPLHVVQIGWDSALFGKGAGSESRERQLAYARLLRERRPGSRMTVVVLGAPAESAPFTQDNLSAVPITGRWGGLVHLARKLSEIDRDTPVSVIATQSPLEEAWTMLAISRGRIPVVAQVHFDLLAPSALPTGSALRALAGRTRQRLAIRMLPRYRAVRVVAPEMADRLSALGAIDVRCVPVPILDLGLLRPVAGVPREPRVLFVGRLAPEKNLTLWLEVARRILTVLPQARFDIVGDGALRDRLQAQADAMGLGSAITFHGHKQRAELPALYASATVFLLTSDHEGFGRVLVEALAAGTAVVSTRTSGAREVLADGEVGLLADCGDAAALADGVLALLTDPQRRAALVSRGRQRIEGRYDPLRLTAEWIDMLIDAAEHPSPTADPKRAS